LSVDSFSRIHGFGCEFKNLLDMKTILLCLFCVCSISAFGQYEKIPVEPDARLYEIYDEDYLTRLQTSNPFLLQRRNFYLDNAYILSENIKNADYPLIRVKDVQNINILLLEKEQSLRHDFKVRTYYSIADTNKILIYRSGEEFRDALNEHLNRAHKQNGKQLQAGKSK